MAGPAVAAVAWMGWEQITSNRWVGRNQKAMDRPPEGRGGWGQANECWERSAIAGTPEQPWVRTWEVSCAAPLRLSGGISEDRLVLGHS